jgi:transposase InsO family protein
VNTPRECSGSLRTAGRFPVDGRPGSALDNAVIEAWHSTLELELRSREHFATQAKVAAWIDDYNQRRRHSALRMMSPVDYEQALQTGEAA